MNKKHSVNRRNLLKAAAGMSVAGPAALILPSCVTTNELMMAKGVIRRKGKINHSVAHWCFKGKGINWKVDLTCQIARHLGCKSVELLSIEGQDNLKMDWDILRKYDLVNAMYFCHGSKKGLNNLENWSECLKALTDGIDACFHYGFPNVLTFTGLRGNISDDVGAENCVTALKKIMHYAEQRKVNVCLEMISSPDYQGDHIDYCMEIIKKVGSPRMKLLFDIYHVQVMDDNIIAQIRQYKDYIGHYHVAGNPGRCEPDNRQEINYKPIMEEIVRTGFAGYVGQEFIPTGDDPLESLAKAIALCDV